MYGNMTTTTDASRNAFFIHVIEKVRYKLQNEEVR